jgi:hypothetical protein
MSESDAVHPALTKTTGFALLFALVLLSRLPFLDAGYGVSPDAWRVARVAREMSATGEYAVSRFPGYPFHEIICSVFWRGGPSALNGLSAFFSAIAATAFAAITRKLGCRDWFLAGLAVAMTPIFFVSSVSSKDYIWALAFVLLSVFFALNGRAFSAGVFLGVAAGCRLTSLAMILPIALILSGTKLCPWRTIIKFAIAAGAVALLAFVPVWQRYGVSFLTFYANHARPTWPLILMRSTVELWGALGLVALGIAAAGAWLTRKQPRLTNYRIVASLLLIVAIYIAAYLRLPDQAGYLLPIVPAILLLVCLFTSRRFLQTALCCLLIAPFVELAPVGLRPGAILADHQRRVQNLANIRAILKVGESAPGSNVFVVGASEPQIAVLAPHLQKGRNHYVYTMTASEAKAAVENGQSLYYLPTVRRFNYSVNGVDLAQYGARDMRSLLDPFKTTLQLEP